MIRFFSKKIEKRSNNKGAAVISVMIGILFITILASSLLYMATMNMQMKGLRHGSTDNFYTAEYALDDMLSQIRQMVKVSDDPANTIETTLKQSTGDYFSETALRNLIHIDTVIPGMDPTFGTNGVEVSCIYKTGSGYSRKTFVKNGGKYTLYGVRIAVKMDEAHGAYESSITTDIQLEFPSSIDKGKEINDFSVLADCPLNISAGSHIFMGCMYCHKNNTLKYTDSSGHEHNCAMIVGAAGMANVIGDYNFFDGDVVVKKGGVLVLGGEVLINGNLHVDPGATLYVAHDIQVQGTVSFGNSVKIAEGVTVYDNASDHNYTENTSVNWDFYNNEDYEHGLAKTLLATYIETEGEQAAKRQKTPQEFVSSTGGSITGSGMIISGQFDHIDGHNDVTVKAAFATQPIHSSEEYKDTLVLTDGDFDLHNVEAFKDCTLLSYTTDKCINLDTTVKSNIWGNMSDDKYEAAKKLFITPPTGGNFAGWDSGSTGGFLMKYPAAGSSLDDVIKTSAEGEATETFQLFGSINVVRYSGNESRACYRTTNNDASGNTNYIPVGAFLSENTSEKIATFMSGSSDTSAPSTDMVIKLVNWTKD